MGINRAWKPILENTFGYLFIESIPPEATIDVIIDDFSLNFRKVLWGLNNWSELIDRLKSRITSKINPNLKQYVILFDEPLYVPRSKQCTQKKRLNESVHRGVTPFSDTEIEFINIGENVIIPDSSEDSNLFINRLMMTRKLFPQLISFCCQKIISICPTIPYPIQFIIDGGYTNGIDFDILQTKLLVDENCVLNLTDEPKFITINNTNQDKSIHIQKNIVNIGESDFKIPRNISHTTQGNIYIRSNDSDTICILLLHMRSWINPLTGRIKYGIFVDTEMTSKHGEITDIVSLWRKILVYYKEHYPGIKYPIETQVMLILLTGSDYTDGFPQLGPKKIWDSFSDGGHKILYPNSKRKHNSDIPNIESMVSSDYDDQTIIMEFAYGNPDQRYGIKVAEHRVYQFIAYMYHKFIMKSPYPEQGIKNLDAIRSNAKERDSRCKRDSSKWNIPDTDEEIYAKIRRVVWNLDYFLNGSKITGWMDPLSVDQKTGKSMFGWDYIYDCTNDVETKTNNQGYVRKAKIVYRSTQ